MTERCCDFIFNHRPLRRCDLYSLPPLSFLFKLEDLTDNGIFLAKMEVEGEALTCKARRLLHLFSGDLLN